MGIVQRSRNPAMENLSQFLLRRLALFPPASQANCFILGRGPIQAVFLLSFYVQGRKPIPATGFQQ